MNDYTVEDIQYSWQVGFEAGVAFALRRFTENGADIGNINKLIGDLQALRSWKSMDEWKEFVERNCITDGRYF